MNDNATKMGFLVLAFVLFLFWECTPSGGEAAPRDPCEIPDNSGLISLETLRNMYRGEVLHLTEPHFLEARVVSSDLEGNIFGALYLQETAGGHGLLVKTDLLDTHAYFPEGTPVRIALEGLFLDLEGTGLALGSPREVFGNTVLDRIPAAKTLEHISPGCGEAELIRPEPVALDSLRAAQAHSLVVVSGVEIDPEYAGDTFAEAERETIIPLRNCSGGMLDLINSGYSDFYRDPLPSGNGSATGILLGNPGDYSLVLRHADDLQFSDPDCLAQFPPESSDRILISEIADPDNDAGARFIELYNSGSQSVRLDAWKLVRFTNANESPGGMALLDGLEILPRTTLVLAARGEAFEARYGMEADILVRTNGPADSNGDDNIVLLDPFDQVIDVFGVPGEDGSGTAHEFEDGRALRRPGILQASPVFIPEQWVITNDTGAAGTLLDPGQAPEDYTPGKHPDPD